MDIAAFEYDLPAERIAQEPVHPRDSARLLTLDRGSGELAHRAVRDLPSLLREGDLLVVNDTRVVPARVVGRKRTGGRVELLFLGRSAAGRGSSAADERWRVMLGASRAPRPGAQIALPGEYHALVEDGPSADGTATVILTGPGPAERLFERHGRAPLPPYVRREDDDPRLSCDRDSYQTVFARHDGAVAAPTAGLHFTPELLRGVRRAGVRTARVTLHVGEGTFRPLRARRLEDVELHPERYSLPVATSEAIDGARRRGGRVVAVGTTVVRALESRPERAPRVPRAGSGETRLFVRPGHRFRIVDALMTNFHLPGSSLLVLVAAFAGRERTLAAYREAVEQGYRFYSYGDAMLVT
ncbi:MAG: tRNA preQ1(34) S-adenosylmethionine ribosyltransferase-isomerase QueA [Acidobacteriota bacterium]|nr:tRNA preQ1(34) S-adenosylmethionine ribosyltransferase-isomerase QueA [Acidobacteriota bacterium]